MARISGEIKTIESTNVAELRKMVANMSEKCWINTNQLLDLNGECLAHFLIMQDSVGKSVTCVPNYGMFWLYSRQCNNYLIRHPMELMMPEHYLGYLATIAAHYENASLAYDIRMVGGKDFINVKLVKGMEASAIAKLTGFDLEFVKNYYRDYFVVNTTE